jgi:hypothetical protein
MPIIEGAYGAPLQNAGAPVAGTDEVQTLTFGGTWIAAETFRLSFGGFTTAPITWSATNATLVANIDAALEALPNIGDGGVTTAVGTMTNGIGTITVTFAGANVAKRAQPTITVAANGSAAGTLSPAETTPGVDATGRGAPKGSMLVRQDTGVLYINTGTAQAPTWTVVGSQS